MSSLRETKNRIKSVKNTEKITRAMKMVAASKLRKAQEEVQKPRAYVAKLNELTSFLSKLNSAFGEEKHPLLESRTEKKKIEILSITSDRGLCGSLNSSVIRAIQGFIFENQEKFKNVEISCIGKKGYEAFFKSGLTIRNNYLQENKAFDFDYANNIALDLCDRFMKKELDAVFLVYNEFKSAITQNIVIKQLLPIEQNISSEQNLIDFVYEPKQQELLDFVIPKHFASVVYQAYLESFASEQGARMTAMDNATRNAKEMTEKLTLEYNRARQAAITKELMEIISGAEAL